MASTCEAPGGPAGQPAQAQPRARIDRGLSRRQRIVLSRVFHEAFDQDRCGAGKYMVMWIRTGPEAALRLGVVAGRRTCPTAVERARAKRLLREAYRLNRHRFRGELDVVLVARRPILTASTPEVEKDLLGLARRAGLLPANAGKAER